MSIKLLQAIGTTAAVLLTTTVTSAGPYLSQSTLQLSLEFPPAPEREGAQSSAGGGTRSGDGDTGVSVGRSARAVCSQGETPLTVLMPKEPEIQKTISVRPQWFLYVPQTSATTAEFLLLDDNGDDVHIDTLELSETPGIVQISLPEDVALEVGKIYIWQVIMNCGEENPSAYEAIQGEIERIALSDDLKTQIEATNDPLKQAELYAQQRIWPDTLMLMMPLRESNPTEWEQLLQSVELEAIASVPVIEN
ncbi:MAG: DUF928 domain-containing protein [Microcoleaceae cyanobacterium]